MDMETAPRDGTRILIKHWVWAYDFLWGEQVRTKAMTISECWWVKAKNRWEQGHWEHWRGNVRTHIETIIDPIAWCHIPEELADKSPSPPTERN